MIYGYQFIDKYQFRLSESDRTAKRIASDCALFCRSFVSETIFIADERTELNESSSVVTSLFCCAIRFALGQSENTHDLSTAQTKALTAIQYTVAVRDKMIDAYKEIMNMQI